LCVFFEMAAHTVSSHLQPAYASYATADGVKEFGSRTLEGNWQEERARVELNEPLADRNWAEGALMAGAEARVEDYEMSIAPATRDPLATSLGRLISPDRLRRSRITNDSTRQGADDGFREYTSMTSTFMPHIADRPSQPVSHDPSFHSTWGGAIQVDNRTKTRYSAQNRSKNQEIEPPIIGDGDAKSAKKMINMDNLTTYGNVNRESSRSQRTGDFAVVVPRHPPAFPEKERLQSTSRSATEWVQGTFTERSATGVLTGAF